MSDDPSRLTEFRTKFRVEELAVSTSTHWTVSVRPIPSTLGACVISLNRFAERLSDVTPEEFADLSRVVAGLEGKLRSLFSYDRINYLMLMMVDDHVHWHVLPRYAEPREFAGATWTDDLWPKPPDVLANAERGTIDVLMALRDALTDA